MLIIDNLLLLKSSHLTFPHSFYIIDVCLSKMGRYHYSLHDIICTDHGYPGKGWMSKFTWMRGESQIEDQFYSLIYLFVYLFIYLVNYLFICLFIYLFIYLSKFVYCKIRKRISSSCDCLAWLRHVSFTWVVKKQS